MLVWCLLKPFRKKMDPQCTSFLNPLKVLSLLAQGIIIKGREMALVWHEKASRTALQTSSLLHTHTLLVQTHNTITVKEIAEQFVVNNN